MSQTGLEDCLTNLLALTDLSGIKWSCFHSDDIPYSNLVSDPILVAHKELSQNHFLSTWACMKRANKERKDLYSFQKELWVFWYGDRPHDLDRICKNLKEVQSQSGHWSKDHFTYECRCHLFKAFHGLIERCLLRKGFFRLGKWFLLPIEQSSTYTEQVSCSFDFFLHGESHVIVSLKTRTHSLIRRVQSTHFDVIDHYRCVIPVILSPYGLSANLIGLSKLSVAEVDRLRTEWRAHFPSLTKHFEEENKMLFFSILMGGVRMDYPSQLVLICDTDYDSKPMKSILSTQHEPLPVRTLYPIDLKERITLSTTSDESCKCVGLKSRRKRRKSDPKKRHVRSCSTHQALLSTLCDPNDYQPHAISDAPVLSQPPTPHTTQTAAMYADPIMPTLSPQPNHKVNSEASHVEPLLEIPASIHSPQEIILDGNTSGDWVQQKFRAITRTRRPLLSQTSVLNSGSESYATIYDKAPLETWLHHPIRDAVSPSSVHPTACDSAIYEVAGEEKLLLGETREEKLSEPALKNPDASELNWLVSPNTPSTYTDERAVIPSTELGNIFPSSDEDEPPVVKTQLKQKPYDNTADLSKIYPTPPSIETQLSPPQYSKRPETTSKVSSLAVVMKTIVSKYGKKHSFLASEGLLLPDKFTRITLPSELKKKRNRPIPTYHPYWGFLIPPNKPLHSVPQLIAHSVASAEPTTHPSIESAHPQSVSTTEKSPASSGGGPPSQGPPSQGPPSSHGPMSQGPYSVGRTPMSVDIQSPASHGPPSIINIGSVQSIEAPYESEGLSAVLVLSDSVLTLVRDRTFDSCVACICDRGRLSVGGAEAGIYVKDASNSDPQSQCSCGFSSSVNRLLAYDSGLFYEDEIAIVSLLPPLKKKIETLSNSSPLASSALSVVLQSEFWMPFEHSRFSPCNVATSMLDIATTDGGEACLTALDFSGKLQTTTFDENMVKSQSIHEWAYAELKRCSDANFASFARYLQPMITDELQKYRKAKLWETGYSSGGQLSWKDFYRLAGRGQDSTTQPIPQLLVSHDNENLQVSPLSIPYWTRLQLAPRAGDKSVFYLGLSPESDLILDAAKKWLHHLSAAYESLNLGTFRPILPLEVLQASHKYNPSLFDKFGDNSPIPWIHGFQEMLPRNSDKREILATYGLFCKRIIPFVIKEKFTNEANLFFIIINPFESYGWSEQFFIHCFSETIAGLSPAISRLCHLQIIPLSSLYSKTSLKPLAFSAYSRCRSVVKKPPIPDSICALEETKQDSIATTSEPPCLLHGPITLAPHQHMKLRDRDDKAGVLFCCYCLSDDQRWLLVSCTDQCGELLETSVINVDVPMRIHLKSSYSVRKDALRKLWSFVTGLICRTHFPWRLVITRFGRIGHGELRSWSGLLARENLGRVTRQTGGQEPVILSACLISMEWNDVITTISTISKSPDGKIQNNPKTRASLTTHILVVPVSAKVQSASSACRSQADDLQMEDLFQGPSDMWDDIFNDLPVLELPKEDTPVGSNDGMPRLSPSGMLPDMNTPLPRDSVSRSIDPQDETSTLLEQPLALGYYISDALCSKLPRWFCRNQSNNVSSFKTSLHIHVGCLSQSQEELVIARTAHALDSSLTTDVLRYALERFNALSWLTIDPVSGDRRSCLPFHLEVLLQLSRTFSSCLKPQLPNPPDDKS